MWSGGFQGGEAAATESQHVQAERSAITTAVCVEALGRDRESSSMAPMC
ncbi:hypothetical protein DB30_03836 [Enhygromyxa salina]|uniref:Uncharacterized protein n=1 Tax=Enhygromyxa salina TaxID=215803 RepID=A0A0C2DCZ4_9BACT|nr:hypothetical protein DB30_03836 [Enhygromyxa salina]